MKILLVNTFDRGGAGIACRRFHEGLMNIGVSSDLLVRERSKKLPHVHAFMPSESERMKLRARRILFELRLASHPVKNSREVWKEKFISKLPEGAEYYSFPDTRFDITETDVYKQADLIHLHWVADFLDYESFFRKNTKPLVWTLHDMAPFKGGKHYEEKHLQFSDAAKDVEKKNLEIKKAALSSVKNLNVVTPSRWLGSLSSKSEVLGKFPHSVISNGVDANIYKPLDKNFARDVLGIPRDRTAIVFVADNLNNARKGFSLLTSAISALGDNKALLCAIGAGDSTLPSNVMSLGRIDDERLMAIAYSAADVFVIPSLEDNFPNTVVEAHMCGTPIIGFPTGGIKEMIDNNVDGLLCTEVGVESLRRTIEKFIQNPTVFDRQQIHRNALAKYELIGQTKKYLELYNTILSNSK